MFQTRLQNRNSAKYSIDLTTPAMNSTHTAFLQAGVVLCFVFKKYTIKAVFAP